ncbi:methionyl-tRNA formyltransferase [Saccharospirillum sp. MSK14-1]|uniref:methionyl-tRNA formyltransferase n=1 Tax=Saccharospirillum sp. MSK14-1 TaxID=1897632 RepID=UPI000D3587EE|nr:methionyl-tRNA formyltransferase [Saccharospirillum sp. MSK14-1]PTY37674.1 methionyl-tRNA formyltransferase [Saccharospirillum sp. MSK14-1]
MSLNIVFAGTPEFAAEHLKVLLSSNHNVVAVYTQPDRPAGRGRKLTPSPVKTVAVDANLPVYQPTSLKSADAQTELAAIGADILVVVAYGLLLPQAVLDTPRLGCINVHASLLPRWRGAAPIHRALLAGDARTGVTIMQMDIGLDTGAMLLKADCAIEPTDTSAVLHDRLIELGRPALIEALDGLEAGTLSGEQQDDALATYATKLSKAEGELDWHRSAADLDRQIRGLTPWPGSYTRWNGDTLKVQQACLLDDTHTSEPGDILAISDAGLDVACGDGVLRLERIQLPGKKAMTVADVLRARRADFEAQPKLGEANA